MAAQNDGRQEWDERDESGDERNTMESQQSDEQMAAMATDRQIIVSGTSQLGEGSKQYRNSTDNSTSNNVVYNNCNFFYVEKCAPNGNQPQQVGHSFQIEGSQQLPGLSSIPQAERLPEQCLQHMHNHIQAQSSWMGFRCQYCGSLIPPDHSPPTPSQPVATASSQPTEPTPSSCPQDQSQLKQPKDGTVRLASLQPGLPQPCSTDSRQDTCQPASQRKENNQVTYKKGPSEMIKRTYDQSEGQLPRCSGSTETNPTTVMKTEDIQTAPTENPDDIRIVDSQGREVKPGDGVKVGFWFLFMVFPRYYGIYIGNMQVVRCDKYTQKVIIEKLDVSRQFIRLTPYSEGRCEIIPPQMRANRARSSVGDVPPVRETWCGVDFVAWTFTGLNWRQALKEGFDLCCDWRRRRETGKHPVGFQTE